MAVYFIPKTRLISRATGINFKPKNWTKWTKRQEFSTSHHYYNHHEQSSKSSKGKLHKIRQWKKWAILPTISILDYWLLAAAGWFSWQGVILRWTPIGIVIVAAASYHLHKQDCIKKGLPQTFPAWQTMVYCSLPLRFMSRCFGWLAERPVPETFRPFIYGLYSSAFHVNIDEALVTDLKYYRSLSHFFTRLIKDDCRKISSSCIVSPADGRVLHFGPVNSATHLEQVKGITYTLESFFGSHRHDIDSKTYIDSIKKRREGTTLFHCIIYLAPGDYHRFHSPAEWRPNVRRHFHGELLSVNPKIAKLVPGLFCINERVVYMGEWEHGFFSFTAVGATNVGSVQVYMDEDLRTNRWRGFKIGSSTEYDEINMDEKIALGKGELLGQFNMGSTIVLVFEAPESYRFNLKTNQVIKVGQSLGCLLNDANDNDNDSGMESEE